MTQYLSEDEFVVFKNYFCKRLPKTITFDGNCRGSRSHMFFKTGVVKKFHRETFVLESLFNKAADVRPGNLLNRDSNTNILQ